LEYKDAQSGRIVSIGANGIISFHISDGRKFIEKVLGSRDRYNAETLVKEMLPKIFDEFAEHLLWAITSENISYEMLDLKLKEIGSKLLPKLNFSLDKYGIHSEEFIIRQFIKAGELKERLNQKTIKTEQYDDVMLDADRKLELLKKQEMLEQQHMKMEQSRNQHEIDLEKSSAQLEADIEKMSYEAKGASFKELHEMRLEEIKTTADGEAKIAEAKKVDNDTVVIIKKENTGKCPHCDGDISADQIFCPTCKKKII
jgi:membrane protease subunit (stomatin/prohibitin family)